MTSQAGGPLSSAPTCSPGRPWKRSASLRPTDLFGLEATASAASINRRGCHVGRARSTLGVRPGQDPIVVVHAVAAAVAAVGERRLPVVHALPERRIGRV